MKSVMHLCLDGEKAVLHKMIGARLTTILIFALCVYGVMGARLFQLTVMPNLNEPDTEITRGSRAQSDALYYGRSDIVDRNSLLLATTLPATSLYVDAKLVSNPEGVASDLMRIFPSLNRDDLVRKLSSGRRFVWLKRGLTPAQHKAINQLGHHGLGFQKETRRFYPQGALFSHLLGYVGVDGRGLAGVERGLDTVLSRAESPMVLTLDLRVQYAAEKALRQAVERFNAIGGAALVVKVKTGEVLASVSYPDFDPHFPSKGAQKNLFNRYIGGVYEMGSTFKIFSTAAYLEQSNARLSDRFDARKPLKQGRFSIRDYHPQKRVMSVPDVFIHSSNIGTALMAQKVGTETLKTFYDDLGLFNGFSVDGLDIARPLYPKPWRDVNTLTVSYGHGVAVTPYHLMQAFLSVVGDGTQARLKIVPANEKGENAGVRVRLVSDVTNRKVRKLLRLAVAEGTGGNVDIKGYNVGGKTGTADKAVAGGYDREKKISSFLAAFPMNDPEYAVFVMVDEPKGRKDTYGYATGGWVAAPAASDIIRSLISIYSIPPVGEEVERDFLKNIMPMVYTKKKKSVQPASLSMEKNDE